MVIKDLTRAASPQRGHHITRKLLLVIVALIAAGGFIVGTPFALLAIGYMHRGDWIQFSNEGQAYGGIAAVFGTLALVGVAVSLVLQSRESAANREVAQRTIHSDLMSKALDDPVLRACWGPSRHGDDELDKQHAYSNMIVSFWRSMFEIGKITEDQLHASSARMFANAPGRRYWSIAGPHQEAHYVSDRDKKFVQILQNEYERAKANTHIANRPKAGSEETTGTPVRDYSAIAAAAAGFAGGALIAGAAYLARHRRQLRLRISTVNSTTLHVFIKGIRFSIAHSMECQVRELNSAKRPVRHLNRQGLDRLRQSTRKSA